MTDTHFGTKMSTEEMQQTALTTTTTTLSINKNYAAISKGQQISINHQEKTLKVVM